MNEEINKSLGIFKQKDDLRVPGVTLEIIDQLRFVCKEYPSVASFIRPLNEVEIELEMDYFDDEDISIDMENEENKQEIIFNLITSLFHYLDIVEDEELSKLNGRIQRDYDKRRNA